MIEPYAGYGGYAPVIAAGDGLVPAYPTAGITYGAAPSYAAPIYNRPSCFCY